MIQLHEGRVLAGRYRLGRAMGQGGMGLVWVARHLQLDIDVAVKFMAPAYVALPEMRARFEREAKAAALLKSQNVVHVYDYGVEDDTPYIVMELLEGEDLLARHRRVKRMSPADTARIVVQLGKALKRAHDAGLVHRDLKPANVFLAKHDDEEVVKILDFGIVKATGKVLPGLRTNGHLMMGSPHYMAPEQVFDSVGVDHRADLWSLGVITFRCLAGRTPFVSRGQGELIMEIFSGQLAPASALAPWLGPCADAFFARALARDPAERFQSAAELAKAFVEIDWSRAETSAAWAEEEPDDAATLVRPSNPGAMGADLSPAPGTAMLSPLSWTNPPLPPFRIIDIGDLKPRGRLVSEHDTGDPVASSPPVMVSLRGGGTRRTAWWAGALVAATMVATGAATLAAWMTATPVRPAAAVEADAGVAPMLEEPEPWDDDVLLEPAPPEAPSAVPQVSVFAVTRRLGGRAPGHQGP